MKTLYLLIISFFFISCQKNSEKLNFDFSFTDGWAERFSFALTDSIFHYKTTDGYISDKISEQEYLELQNNILEIKKTGLKSEKEKCIDCPKFCLIVEGKTTRLHVVKNGDLIDLENSIKKIVAKRKIDTTTIQSYNFKSEMDLVTMPPIPIISK